MRHLVVGGTGTVGSRVVHGLVEKGETVRVLTRSRERAQELPDGASAAIGDLLDPDTYDQVFCDFDHVFILNAVAPTELHEGLAALNESGRAGARRIVYLSVHHAEDGAHVPHFAAKIQIEKAIAESGIPFTILRPCHFFQNDLWSREAILEFGIYPQPLGDVGVSRVDVRDIAAAAVRALTEDGHENRTYSIAGPHPLTGRACADAYSEALGREIRYVGNDLDAWGAQARQVLPNWMVWDFQRMFDVFQEKGLVASDAELRETGTIIGREPRRFEDFVRETVEGWT